MNHYFLEKVMSNAKSNFLERKRFIAFFTIQKRNVNPSRCKLKLLNIEKFPPPPSLSDYPISILEHLSPPYRKVIPIKENTIRAEISRKNHFPTVLSLRNLSTFPITLLSLVSALHGEL